RVPFEPIIEVIVLSLVPCKNAGEEIRGNERRSPSLDLPDVSLFVVTAKREAPRVSSDDHMPECHCREAPLFAEPSRESTVEFDCAAPHLSVAACAQGERAGHKPDQRGGRGPCITKQPKQRAISPRKRNAGQRHGPIARSHWWMTAYWQC